MVEDRRRHPRGSSVRVDRRGGTLTGRVQEESIVINFGGVLSLIRQKRTAEQVPKRFVFDVAENPTPEMGNNLAHDTRC